MNKKFQNLTKFLAKLLILLFSFSLSSIAVAEYNDSVRYLHVQKGQTLHNIVKRLYPGRIKEWPKLTRNIVNSNPHAFVNSDPTKMKAGVRLKLPAQAKKSSALSKRVGSPSAKKVGEVVAVSGRVVAVGKDKVSRKLQRGLPVYIGDKVITGEDGSVRLRMVDDAVLDLRCFSIMVIEDYAINTVKRRSILNLLQGSLKKVTGKIGKMSEDVYELKTPVASVGVRGTEYALRVFQSKGCGGTIDTDDGLYLEVIKGLVDVKNDHGKEVIAKGEAVYVALPETAPKKEPVRPGIVTPEPIPVPEPVVEEESNNLWWWLLGAVAIALLI